MNDGDAAALAPLCECGCGLPVRSQRYGIWSRWRAGHSHRPRAVYEPPVVVEGMQLSMLADVPEFPLPYGAEDDA